VVLAVDRDLGTVRRAAAAARDAWAQAGTTMVEKPLAALSGIPGDAIALVNTEHGIVECVADRDFGPVAAAARRLSAEGWRVVVLAPAPAMGEAHRVLRGVPVRIQPWWSGADETVLFGVPEVP
jgi:hypothetical protein